MLLLTVGEIEDLEVPEVGAATLHIRVPGADGQGVPRGQQGKALTGVL